MIFSVAQAGDVAEGGNAKTNIRCKGHLKNKQHSVRRLDCLGCFQKGSDIYVDSFCRLIEWYQELSIPSLCVCVCVFRGV